VQEHRSDPGTQALRHQGDVDDADLIAPFIDPEPADGLAVPFDDVPLAGRIVDVQRRLDLLADDN
jgi:hypothetical protein